MAFNETLDRGIRERLARRKNIVSVVGSVLTVIMVMALVGEAGEQPHPKQEAEIDAAAQGSLRVSGMVPVSR